MANPVYAGGLGHEPVEEIFNIRKELKRLRQDPLIGFTNSLRSRGKPEKLLHDEISLYQQAYGFYVFSMSRYLTTSSLARRCQWIKYWEIKHGRYVPPWRHVLAKRYHEAMQFALYDLVNCLIHARILLDRTIHLSRIFLSGGSLPSFVSFNDHKKFFLSGKAVRNHEEYGEYFCKKTEWFDIPIKYVRDKFFVHSGPPHWETLAFPIQGYELALVITSIENEGQSNERVKIYRLSIHRMLRDIDSFLRWFGKYGLKTCGSNTK